ncbi:hypothetical protein FGG08_000109 [Glutinoglossum americanum]|uniref:Heterokaryon incompatibility domain-containing protein n=1 Tax=Glutinoglossum americanum TaxID=1670608 RepID=A0A9P8IB30_9PEZI|nr:hypothetical protein FGG08_000109 [Glutinoglossum americanum]
MALLNDCREPYDALSWCWGPPGPDEKEIRIFHGDRSYILPLSRNLDSALQRLRDRKVPMMASVYGKASHVYVWLGEERDDSKLAIEFIKNRVLNLPDFDRLVKDRETSRAWSALSALMKREWFSRRWIVQEIALARDAVLLCGPHDIKWLDFADAISLFNEVETGTRSFSEVMRSRDEFRHIPDFFGHVPAFSATRLVEVANNLFRRLAGDEREALLSLEYLVSTFSAFQATQARDTIYALLAIARDTLPHTTKQTMDNMVASYSEKIKTKFIEQMSKKAVSKPYHVDYSLPVSDVYVEFVKFSIAGSDQTRALDIICRPWAPLPKLGEQPETEDCWRAIFGEEESKRPPGEGLDSIPSWIPSIADAAFGIERSAQSMRRKNADTLVGVPPQRNYMAAGSRVVTKELRFEDGKTEHSSFSDLNGTHYHSMFVEGFILDTVAKLGDTSQHGNIPEDWSGLGRNRKSDSQTRKELPEEFWRTLVADRGPNGGNALRYYPRLISHAFEQGVPGDTLNTSHIINWGSPKVVGDVLRRIQSVIWNRRLTRTEKLRLGLVPKAAKQGDLVCILYGCSVPVVMRKIEKTREGLESQEMQRKEKRRKVEMEAAIKIAGKWRKLLESRKAASLQAAIPKRSPHAQSTAGASPSQKRKRNHGDTGGGLPGKKWKGSENVSSRQATNQNPENHSTAATSKLKNDNSVFYQLIGECYVHGMMNGEAIHLQLERTLFEIRVTQTRAVTEEAMEPACLQKEAEETAAAEQAGRERLRQEIDERVAAEQERLQKEAEERATAERAAEETRLQIAEQAKQEQLQLKADERTTAEQERVFSP